MCFKKSIGLMALFAFVALPLPAFALMLGLSTEKLTHSTPLIITGEVEKITSQWTTDGKRIATTAVVRVEQVIKGRVSGRLVRVMYMGGQVGDIIMRQSDVAPLHKGETVLLFLSPEMEYSGGAAHRIQGRAQGTYTIGKDHIARKKGFSVLTFGEHLDVVIPLDTLTKKIRGYVDAQ